MVILTSFKQYVAKKRVMFYDKQGMLSHISKAVLPSCPEDVIRDMKSINAEWEKEYPGRPYFLFPGDEGYPEELLQNK